MFSILKLIIIFNQISKDNSESLMWNGSEWQDDFKGLAWLRDTASIGFKAAMLKMPIQSFLFFFFNQIL